VRRDPRSLSDNLHYTAVALGGAAFTWSQGTWRLFGSRLWVPAIRALERSVANATEKTCRE
jgi:hypothetical protein